jgi:hypothetical protein
MIHGSQQGKDSVKSVRHKSVIVWIQFALFTGAPLTRVKSTVVHVHRLRVEHVNVESGERTLATHAWRVYAKVFQCHGSVPM